MIAIGYGLVRPTCHTDAVRGTTWQQWAGFVGLLVAATGVIAGGFAVAVAVVRQPCGCTSV